MIKYVASIGLLILLGFPLTAQTTTGKIVGTVTDPSGSIVPGAKVTVTDQGTSHSRTTSTDAQGHYEFPFLPVATYAISVQAQGFQTSGVQSFPLNVDQVARVDVKLALGQTSENVKVEASAILMQTENASVGTVIDSTKVVDLPLNGRSFVQLALLTPGVNPGTPGSITLRRNRGSLGQSVGMAANGARDTQNRFYYDGIESMDLDSYSFSFSPSVDAINQFRVATNSYSAEIGGAPGGQVNLTTKSGTNAFHGTAWEFNRNDAFEAFNAFQPRTSGAKPPRLNRNQFGANLGGPVWIPKLYNGKDKTFFFFNWESGRQISGTYGGQALVPTAALRGGDFSASPATIFDPASGRPFPNNIIPENRIASYATKFLSGWLPLPNINAAGYNYLSPASSAPTNQDQYISRVDHNFSERDTLSVSYMYDLSETSSIGTFVFNGSGNRARAQNVSIGEFHTFSPSVVNELRVGWNRFFEHGFFGTTDNPDYDIANRIGIPGVSSDPQNYGPPTFSAGYTFPSVATSGPRDRVNQVLQLGDNLSVTKGSHFMKFGALIMRRNWSFNEALNPRGTFGFNGTVTAGGASPALDNQFADFLLGLATSAQISSQPFATRLNTTWQAYYFQDDWKILPNLTLNLGMRYEYFAPPVQRGKIANFDLNGFVTATEIFHGFPDIANTGGRPASLVYPDRNNFGPRFGFAWSVPVIPDFVVRGGYGVYYAPEISNTYTDLTFNPPIVNTQNFTGSATNPLQVATAFEGQGSTKAGALGSYAIDPYFRDAYTQEWNLTVEKKLPGQLYFDIGYVASKSNHLAGSYDGNRPLDIVIPGPTTAPIAQRRPLQGFDSILTTKSFGQSNYQSLQAKLERRVGRGLNLIAAYTWSKSLSNVDSSTVGGGSYIGGVQNYMDLAAEKSYSGFDLPQRLSIAAIYDLPLLNKTPGLMRTFFGGWQLGAIITAQTGIAASVGGGYDTTGTGITSRLNVVPGQKVFLDRGQRSSARWFNTAAFTSPTPGSFGNSARMEIHVPGLEDVDASATKSFRFLESQQVMFRAEFFNALNHVNLGPPGTSILNTAAFGRITTAGDPRVVQFGLKYSF